MFADHFGNITFHTRRPFLVIFRSDTPGHCAPVHVHQNFTILSAVAEARGFGTPALLRRHCHPVRDRLRSHAAVRRLVFRSQPGAFAGGQARPHHVDPGFVRGDFPCQRRAVPEPKQLEM